MTSDPAGSMGAMTDAERQAWIVSVASARSEL
jgi:hypothetical protein